jgi:hypothetical protein
LLESCAEKGRSLEPLLGLLHDLLRGHFVRRSACCHIAAAEHEGESTITWETKVTLFCL